MSENESTNSPDYGKLDLILEYRDLMDKGDEKLVTNLLAQTTTDTLGWDTTYVIKANDANRVLTKYHVWDTMNPFSATLGPGFSISNGTFGPWQITSGGAGQDLHMSVEVPSATFNKQNTVVPISNMTCIIEVKLNFLPQPSSTTSSGTLNNLKVKLTSDSTTDPVVSVTELRFSGTAPSAVDRALIQGTMAQWFNDNLDKFTHVFASVNLGERADKASFQWLKPTDVGYAYFESAGIGYFGVLNQVLNHSASGLSYELGPGSIPSGAKAGFNISQTLFLEQLVLPGMKFGFDGTTDSDFTMAALNTQITNVNEITMKPVVSNGSTYHPKIKPGDLTLDIQGSAIHIRAVAETLVSPGIWAITESETWQEIVLGTKPDGSQTLTYNLINSTSKHHVKKADWVKAIEITAMVLSACAEIGAAILKKIAGEITKMVVAAIIVGILLGVGSAVASMIATIVADPLGANTPGIDLVVSNATDPITWDAAGSDFTLTHVLLNGAFQLGGDPGINA
ncbi:TULIP family P47-like protein [Nitrosopumilus sp.]|uniref:TULIP family P47-like protein n=1 Tax=Nitrosopumilus sp. TaxID=2024843 RepID=UPI00260A4D82|nr:TULIP family P47-like protein [Nitrosopumilus sp.]